MCQCLAIRHSSVKLHCVILRLTRHACSVLWAPSQHFCRMVFVGKLKYQGLEQILGMSLRIAFHGDGTYEYDMVFFVAKPPLLLKQTRCTTFVFKCLSAGLQE